MLWNYWRLSWIFIPFAVSLQELLLLVTRYWWSCARVKPLCHLLSWEIIKRTIKNTILGWSKKFLLCPLLKWNGRCVSTEAFGVVQLVKQSDLSVIVPQTGCSPASAIASFSKQPPSLHHEEPFPDDDIITPRTPSPPNLPHSVSPLSYSPPSSPVGGDVLIPCEFCGITLEENVVFHHQVFPQCASCAIYFIWCRGSGYKLHVQRAAWPFSLILCPWDHRPLG